MERECSIAANLLAVPIEVIDVVHGRDQNREVLCRRGAGTVKGDMAAVPGVARIRRVSLRTPWLARAQPLPVGVVIGGIGPGRVVACTELPFAAERDGSASGVLDGKGLRKSGSTDDERRCEQNEENSGSTVKPEGCAENRTTPASVPDCHFIPPLKRKSNIDEFWGSQCLRISIPVQRGRGSRIVMGEPTNASVTSGPWRRFTALKAML